MSLSFDLVDNFLFLQNVSSTSNGSSGSDSGLANDRSNETSSANSSSSSYVTGVILPSVAPPSPPADESDQVVASAMSEIWSTRKRPRTD